MSRSVLQIQTTLHSGYKRNENKLLGIPALVIEEVMNCLAEVLKVIEVGIVNETNSGAIRDRCLLCFNKAERLVNVLQSTLIEGEAGLRRSGVRSA